MNCPWGEISIPHKLGFSEISSPQSLLPSNVQISNLMLINLFIIVFILLVIHCVWQINKIKIKNILKQKQINVFIYRKQNTDDSDQQNAALIEASLSLIYLPFFFRFSLYVKENSLLSENWTGEKRRLPNTHIYLILSWSLPKMAKVKTRRNFLILFRKMLRKKWYVKLLPKRFWLNALPQN